MSLLEITELSLETGSADARRVLVDELSLSVDAGRTTVVVGESGSGKSLTALSVVRLLPEAVRMTKGRVRLADTLLSALPLREMERVRGARVGFVFQEPQSALNPVMRIGEQIAEVLRRHRGLGGRVLRDRVVELLNSVGLPDPGRQVMAYPHQLSGGMKQRVMIAIALAGEPELLLADEPTTALDVSTQAQILSLLRQVQAERGMGMLFITHDLAVARQMADSLVVMQGGQVLEHGDAAAIFANPDATYTRSLLAASPRLELGRGPAPPALDAPVILEVEDLTVRYAKPWRIFARYHRNPPAVANASLQVRAGETLAVVGESGSGKTTLGRGILRLLAVDRGSVSFLGRDFLALSPAQLRAARRDLQVIFQDPYASMNPRFTVQAVIEEGLRAQGLLTEPGARAACVARLLQQVGLEPASAARYPHEFSGGQRQRISIARALALSPRLIVCDEPTSALDVSVQTQVLALLKELQVELSLAYLFITHNLAVVAEIAHRVAVMQGGRIVESGPMEQVLFAPRHPYTRALLAAVPRL